MIPFKGVEGIKNLYLSERCDVCGKKRKNIAPCGCVCARCFVWTEMHWCYLIVKYIRCSVRKYLYGEVPRPRTIPLEK